MLLFIQLVGALYGRTFWSTFFRGKDPQREFAGANFAGLVVLAVLCFIFQTRLSRLHFLHVLFAFVLGLLSSVVGMGWGVLDGYGR